jgi:HAD superfamily hydrolase (TIGR01509 family)
MCVKMSSVSGVTRKLGRVKQRDSTVNSDRFSLVIFDCDGVLVDSELITNRIFATMLNELGIPVTLEDMFEQFVGRSMAAGLEKIAGLLGRPVPDDFLPSYESRTHAALKSDLKVVCGIEAVLDSLTLPYCVASSGSHEKMQTTLGITGLLPRFQGRMFSVTEVPRGKPSPDVFLYAAAKMGADASDCAVVEDTPTGVVAGVAAGMTVFGYCGLTPRAQLQEAGAHHTFDRMCKLPKLLSDAEE